VVDLPRPLPSGADEFREQLPRVLALATAIEGNNDLFAFTGALHYWLHQLEHKFGAREDPANILAGISALALAQLKKWGERPTKPAEQEPA